MDSLQDELVECHSRLRSQALLYKELKSRHDPALDTEERLHKVIISEFSEDIHFQDPDLQTEYREKFIDGLQEPPFIPKLTLYADQLFDSFSKVEQQFSVSSLKQLLLEYFREEENFNAQLRFKILTRWAHLEEQGQTTCIDDMLENVNKSFVDASERVARLKEDDDFRTGCKKPVPKTSENTNLYLHAPNIEYTNISREDIRLFISNSSKVSYKSRKFKNFLIQLKWLSTCKAFEIWEHMISKSIETRKESIDRMSVLTGSSDRSTINLPKKPLLKEELDHQDSEIEMPPMFISDIKQLQGIVRKISKEFGLKGEMELDDGHSLAYQVTHLFPELYELQRLKLEWAEYGNLTEKQKTEKKLQNLQFMKSYRVTFIRKNSSSSETNVPVLKSFEVAYLKKSDWNKNEFNVKTSAWLYNQNVRLNKIEKNSQQLEQVFQLIDEQNIALSNKALEEIVFHHQISQKSQESEEKKEETLEKSKKYFSILLAENITKQQTSQVKIPSQMIKTYYMLVFLKNRKLKNKIIDLLNAFRSIQRKIIFDLNDLPLNEDFVNCNISQKSKLHDRTDLISEVDDEVYVKDGNGEYVVYDCILDDFKEISRELIKLGTYYINKHSKFSEIDVSTLASEMLDLEYEFQSSKYKLLQVLFHFYNNTVSKEKQQNLGYRILKLITTRPKLCLRNSYFFESYKSCIFTLKSKFSLLNAILQVYPQENPVISPLPFNIEDLFQILSESSESLSRKHHIESSKFQNFLEGSIWDYAFKLWKSVVRRNSHILTAGNLLDNAELMQKVISSLLTDFETGQRAVYPEIEDKNPSKLTEIDLFCNYCKLWLLKEDLFNYLEESELLSQFYTQQASRAGKEVSFLDNLDWGIKIHQEVDEGSGNRSGLHLAVSEIDRSAQSHINFSDIEEIKHLLTPWGMQEFIACLQYQVMHVQALALAVQANQHFCWKFLRIASELQVRTQLGFIPNKYFAEWKEIVDDRGLNVEKLEKYKQRNLNRMQKGFFNISGFKNRNRVQTLEKFKIFVHLHGKGLKDKNLAMLVRRARIFSISMYCKGVLQEIYPLGFKVQILETMEKYTKLVSIIPPSSFGFMFRGEQFFDSERGLCNFSVFPSVEYILDFPMKALENLPDQSNSSDQSRTLLSFTYTWNLSHDLLKILSSLVSVVQLLWIRLFLNFLSIPSEEIIELWESTTNGEKFFNNEKSNVLEQTPETLIEDQITEAFSILKVLNEVQLSLEKEERTKYLALLTRHNFDILTISVISTHHFLRIHSKLESASEVMSCKRRLFKYSDIPFPGQAFQVTHIKHHQKATQLVQPPKFQQLIWTFVNLAPAERSRGFTVAISVQLKTENFLRTLRSTSKMKEIKSLIEFLKVDIHLLRLKSNFYRSQSGEYEVIQEKYREIIEERAEKIIKDVVSKRDIAKTNAEIKILREFFDLYICKESVRVLDAKIKTITQTASTSEVFGTILPVKTAPDYLKKVNLFNGFINLLKNRGTIVQAPQGKAIVYAIKDLAGIVSRLADQSLRYRETEKREYLDKLSRQVQELIQNIKEKHKKLQGYQKTKIQLEKEVSDMVTARITQKGAQFMYEIDVSQRQLKEIKENSHILEVQVREKITQEYIENYKKKTLKLKNMEDEFKNFQSELSFTLRNSIDAFKPEGPHFSSKSISSGDKYEDSEPASKGVSSTLVSLQVVLRRLRENGQWNRLQEMQKFQKFINELKEQLTSNQYLIDQLNESKGREEILKQELRFTQNSLLSVEKLENKLKQQIREMKFQEESLQTFKHQNYKKIQKMQKRVAKFKDFSNIDKTKIAQEQFKQEKMLSHLKNAQLSPDVQYQNFYNNQVRDVENLKKKILQETKILESCEKLTVTTLAELEGIDHFEEGEWKKKYYDLVASNRSREGSFVKKGDSVSPSRKLVIKRSDYTYFTTPERSNRSLR